MRLLLPLYRFGPCFGGLGDAIKYEAQYQQTTMGLVPRMGHGPTPPVKSAKMETDPEIYLGSINVRSNSIRLDKLLGKEANKEKIVELNTKKCPPSMNPPCQYRGGHWMRCKWHKWLAQ